MTLSVLDKAKGKAKHYVQTLLLRLIEECKSLLPSGFISQQDGAPAHTAKLAQDRIATNCSEFIGKDERPPNSPDVNLLDCHVWGVMLEHYKTFHAKPNLPKNTDGLKKDLQLIRDQLPQDSINKAILSYDTELHKTTLSCVKSWMVGWLERALTLRKTV